MTYMYVVIKFYETFWKITFISHTYLSIATKNGNGPLLFISLSESETIKLHEYFYYAYTKFSRSLRYHGFSRWLFYVQFHILNSLSCISCTMRRKQELAYLQRFSDIFLESLAKSIYLGFVILSFIYLLIRSKLQPRIYRHLMHP